MEIYHEFDGDTAEEYLDFAAISPFPFTFSAIAAFKRRRCPKNQH
jgi:hypothetical protein